MERKLNCWEFKNCGREKGGLMVSVLGANGGVAGGRHCWMVRNTNRLTRNEACPGQSCQVCEFYRRVRHEEKSVAQRELNTTVA